MMAGDATSLTLLQRLRNREATAWERFAHLYKPLIDVWCRRWCVADADREDVVQDVMTAVFTHLPNYVPQSSEGSFRAWMRGITRNKLLEYGRSRQQHPEAAGGSVALARINEVAEPVLDETPDDVAGLYLRAAESVRQDFNAQTWDLFWRTTVDAQPAVDVAKEYNVAPATVRMAKARILRRIREEIGETAD
ncbi:sigma-70 family RNA polymerase sigma factor [soil metagenome]